MDIRNFLSSHKRSSDVLDLSGSEITDRTSIERVQPSEFTIPFKAAKKRSTSPS